jgi:hypothetical protein
VFALGLQQIQESLARHADEIQHQFVQISDELTSIGSKLLEVRGEERQELRSEQKKLRSRQQELAQEVNLWRDRAREVLTQRGESSLRAYLEELLILELPDVTRAVEHTMTLLNASDEEREALTAATLRPEATTPAGRLIERAKVEYDLRSTDQAARKRAAVEFANRTGISQDDSVLAEIEGALEDPDPMVQETMILTAIELHRFRSLRLADLDSAHESVQKLASFNHPAVVPVLIEIAENPRTGYREGEAGTEEQENSRSRLVALLRLVEWHTAEAQVAVKGRTFDRDAHIVKAAKHALDLFPEQWGGSIDAEKTQEND